jgi:hypothetical protein
MITALDRVLPDWHHQERHERPVTAPPAAVLSILDNLVWQDVPLFRVLMGIRSLGRTSTDARRRILVDFTAIGFTELHRDETEWVYGGIGRPWSPGGQARPVESLGAFQTFSEPGWAKMAMNFRVADGRLTTETRVRLTDAGARRAFGAYWLVIRPFSGLVRRSWLTAVTRKAQG